MTQLFDLNGGVETTVLTPGMGMYVVTVDGVGAPVESGFTRLGTMRRYFNFTNTPETGTTRTLSLDDELKCIVCSNAAGCAITIPPQSSVAWPNDVEITGVGTLGNCTFLEGLGVSIVKPEDVLLECYKGAPWALRRLALNSWLLTGYLVEA